MWDLPDPRIRGSRLYARGCDDVGGVAAVLAALDVLARGRGPIDVYGLFTRGEEVGFTGAIAACRDGFLPRRARIIAIETSSAIPGVTMGGGPILRVADKSSVFTPHLTTFCHQVAGDLAEHDRRFAFQRRVMDGGDCEATAFCGHGLTATGLCVALGNYHNMNTRRETIAPEYIDLDDFGRLVQWLVALATSKHPCTPDYPERRRRLDRLARKWLPTLKRTSKRVQQGDQSFMSH